MTAFPKRGVLRACLLDDKGHQYGCTRTMQRSAHTEVQLCYIGNTSRTCSRGRDVSSPSGDVEDAGHGAFAVVQENTENDTYRSTRFELCGRR